LELGEADVEPLINLLEDVGYRRDAAKALGKIGGKRALEALIQASRGEDD
jgi:HEAT repeat protein